MWNSRKSIISLSPVLDRKIAQRPETRPSTSSSSSPLSFSSSFSRSKYNRATFFFSIILTTRINTRTILRTSYGYQNFYFYFDSDSSNDLINSGFNLRSEVKYVRIGIAIHPAFRIICIVKMAATFRYVADTLDITKSRPKARKGDEVYVPWTFGLPAFGSR